MTATSAASATSFGAVLINGRGHVLVRQPTGQFGGYAWTFAKGKPAAGEQPADTALRHASADTGWPAEILADIPGTFPGTTSISKFFLAGRIGSPSSHDADTAALRWANFEDAAELIRQSPNLMGRERDLAILAAAKEAMDGLSHVNRPTALAEDWPSLRPLPERHIEIAVDLKYDEREMSRIRKGFLPKDMDEKWFIWFDDDVLHLHRSWTGNCIYVVRFERGDDGWCARTAFVNRDPAQYENTDDEEDRRLLAEMILYHLLDDAYEHPLPFGGGLALALQPNYLGSPAVVSELIKKVVDQAYEHFHGKSNFNGVWTTIRETSEQVASGEEYVRMPGWHTPAGLGEALLKAFEIRPDPILDDALNYHVSEALMALYLKVRELLIGFYADEHAVGVDAASQVKKLHNWAVTVFLGTNDVLYPDVTIDAFQWEDVVA